MPEPKQISAGAALKAFSAQRIKITDFARDSKGNVIVEKKKGDDGKAREIRTPETRGLAERDILGATDFGDRIVIITADGKRYSTADKAEAAKDE